MKLAQAVVVVVVVVVVAVADGVVVVVATAPAISLGAVVLECVVESVVAPFNVNHGFEYQIYFNDRQAQTAVLVRIFTGEFHLRTNKFCRRRAIHLLDSD